ncbi:MAG TPA: hypothetical protein VK094_04230 [Pseudogracilibacillus sp.]|nr:hypothetical protein [Pseudogracilibacillus sp.]
MNIENIIIIIVGLIINLVGAIMLVIGGFKRDKEIKRNKETY